MNNSEGKTINRLASPLWLFLFLLLAIFSGEMLIMFIVLPLLFGSAEGFVPNMADSLLLTLIISPFLWVLIVRPLRNAAITIADKSRQLVEAQEELLRKEKLAVLGQLSGSVGHELRNPLGIMINAVFYLKTVLANADETTKEYLEIIKHEIDNSQRIISDLLDFSRIKRPQTKAVQVHELIRQSLGRCVIPESVRFQTEIPATLPHVSVDPLQMGQVFQNLITNAVQAMPEGGSVRISARKVRGSRYEDERQVRGTRNEERGNQDLNLEPRSPNPDPRSPIPDADFVEINITDTGEGISPENMNKLFHPLFTTKPRGIGLGLVVCKNLVEANGGRIVVASRLGEGTAFSVILPVEEGKP